MTRRLLWLVPAGFGLLALGAWGGWQAGRVSGPAVIVSPAAPSGGERVFMHPVFGSDEQAMKREVHFYIPVPEDVPVAEKLAIMARALSRFRFGDLPISVEEIEVNEAGREVAVIRLADSLHAGSWAERRFQGSAGGGDTTWTLVETFLQRDYAGPWVDGVRFVYGDGRQPLEEYDHVNLAETAWR